jgi:hypothetical protein
MFCIDGHSKLETIMTEVTTNPKYNTDNLSSFTSDLTEYHRHCVEIHVLEAETRNEAIYLQTTIVYVARNTALPYAPVNLAIITITIVHQRS